MTGNGHKSVDELVKALDEQTEPYHAWKLAKEDVHKGTDITGAKADYKEETKGPKLIDKVEQFAVDAAIDLYGGRSKPGDMNAKLLKQQLENDLGDNYGQFREALKIGDRDEANKLYKDALVRKYGTADARPTIEKIPLLEPEERIEAGKKLAPLAKGTDYVTAATNPALVVDVLSKQKQLAETLR